MKASVGACSARNDSSWRIDHYGCSVPSVFLPVGACVGVCGIMFCSKCAWQFTSSCRLLEGFPSTRQCNIVDAIITMSTNRRIKCKTGEGTRYIQVILPKYFVELCSIIVLLLGCIITNRGRHNRAKQSIRISKETHSTVLTLTADGNAGVVLWTKLFTN